MSDRIHRSLDGEIPADALSPAERERLLAVRAAVEAVAGRVLSRPAPDLVERVMQRLPTGEPDVATRAGSGSVGWRAALAWFWAPQPVRLRVRPAFALALLAALAVLPFVLRSGVSDPPRTAQTAAPSAPLYVQFRLEVPRASSVALAGSFTNWQPRYQLHETAPGVWTVLVPLEPGVHDYTFVVDGQRWIPDPHAPQVPDSFGGKNSRLTLLPPGEAV